MNNDTARSFSSVEALRFGWTKTIANLKPLLIIGAVGAFLALLNQALRIPDDTGGLSALLMIAVQVLEVALTLVYIRVALKLHDGEPLDVTRPAGLLSGFFTFLLAYVLYSLIVVGGLVLLIVPGVVWALKFGFAGFLVSDKKLDPIEALRASSRLTDGVKTQLLVFALLLFAVNFLGALALGVGLLVTIPTTFIASAYVFRRLQVRAAERSQVTAQVPPLSAPPATAMP
jgi:uncharacterized membrane protein